MKLKPFDIELAMKGHKIIGIHPTHDETFEIKEIYFFKNDDLIWRIAVEIEMIGIEFFNKKGEGKNTIIKLFMAEEEKDMCSICESQEKKHEGFYCDDCYQFSDTKQIKILAKRIKALEEKVK